MKQKINNIKIEVVQGDIVKQDDIVAIVNPVNHGLKKGGSIASAIHKAAGSDLEEKCVSLEPILPGDAMITGGYNLANEYIIHCLCKVSGSGKSDLVVLATCYYNVLKLADAMNIRSLAFPVIAAGRSGYPVHEAAQIGLTAIKNRLSILNNIELIRFVLYTDKIYQVYEDIFIKIIKEEGN